MINGKEIGKDMDFPDNLGLLIENPAFLDNYSGFANLKMLAEIRNIITDENIREVISRVGLDPDDKKKYKKYSTKPEFIQQVLTPRMSAIYPNKEDLFYSA